MYLKSTLHIYFSLHFSCIGDQFRTWCEAFDLDKKKGEISELLVNNAEIRRLYTKFVSIRQG